MPENSDQIIRGPGYIAKKAAKGYEIEFDPGAHIPQEVKVMLTEQEFEKLRNNPDEFQEIVVPAMERQGIKVS